jgi:uncharacterized membrane protein
MFLLAGVTTLLLLGLLALGLLLARPRPWHVMMWVGVVGTALVTVVLLGWRP